MAKRNLRKYLPFHLIRRHKFISAFVIAITLVVGTWAYEAIALRVDRHNFEQARAAIDAVYADIVSQIGQPDNYKRANDCSRSYQEFTGYGPPTCEVDTNFVYSVADEAEANSLFRGVQSVISNHPKLLKPIMPLDKAIVDTLVVNSYYHAASDSYRASGLSCTVNYVFDTPREISLKINDTSKKPFQVSIGCYGPARGQYYPSAT